MAKIWKSRTTIVFAAAALFVCAGFFVVHLWKSSSEPLRDGPPIAYPVTPRSPSARQQFLDGNFKIIRNVKELPQPILQVFTEQGGTRLLMANPGKKFLATDVIYDSSLPRKRLIFAGVLDAKCFVYYEQGGIALGDFLAFYRLTSKDSMEPLWEGYCGPATDIQDLRSQVMKDECSGHVPSE